MTKQDPTIKLKEKTKERLEKFGSKSDSFDDILNKLMNLAESVKKKIK